MYSLLMIVVLAYLVGSFPTSVVFGRMTKRIDIREYGSRNAGGTDAFRALRWQAGLIVTSVDIAKGVLAVLLVSRIRVDVLPIDHQLVQIIAGASAVIGHIWTVLAKFNGGKGVATAAGVLFALYPWAGFTGLIIFLIIASTTRYVSLGSISSAFILPLLLFTWNRIFERPVSVSFILLSIIIGGLICYTHRSNIRRLLNGTENRFTTDLFKRKI
jgi:glycerol-3-phosphate acyltransferase PlsY